MNNILDIIVIVCMISIVLFIVGAAIYVRQLEHKEFNNGSCRHCDTELRHFDTDSQGGIGWCCDICNNYFWTSWISRKKLKKRLGKEIKINVDNDC